MRSLIVIALFSTLITGCSTTQGETELQVRSYLSETIKIDRIYKSMEGPIEEVEAPLLDGPRELVWLTGFHSSVVDEAGEEALTQEFVCHSNLDIDLPTHRDSLNAAIERPRLFTISQGAYEAELPRGFGIPVWSDTKLKVLNQALNMHESGQVNLRYDNAVKFVRDKNLKSPMKPLYMISGLIQVSLTGDTAYYETLDPTQVQEEASCAPGHTASDQTLRRDSQGQRFTYHWVLPPGREERHTLISTQLRLQYDTRVHYAFIHMHPFGESLTLKDLTTGEVLFTGKMELDENGGILKAETYSSEEGFPLHKDHEYDLISVYNNTSGELQDAMAILYLYAEDKGFRHPSN